MHRELLKIITRKNYTKVLNIIPKQRSVTVNELANLTGIASMNVYPIIYDLMDYDLIVSEGQKYRKRYRFSEKGVELLDNIENAVKQFYAH